MINVLAAFLDHQTAEYPILKSPVHSNEQKRFTGSRRPIIRLAHRTIKVFLITWDDGAHYTTVINTRNAVRL